MAAWACSLTTSGDQPYALGHPSCDLLIRFRQRLFYRLDLIPLHGP
ncbi:MAG: hypothetical protein PF508_22390 [Spirochaeta sp.]|nr:hypothetical protein [Spirochaeta sp.]